MSKLVICDLPDLCCSPYTSFFAIPFMHALLSHSPSHWTLPSHSPMTGPSPSASIDQFGPDAVQSLAPLVVNVLENLDNALGESEDNDRELVELTEKYELLAQQYEKERQRRREAEEVCVCVFSVHT